MTTTTVRFTGRAFTINNSWYVEKDNGSELQIAGGEQGRAHPVLLRGRDENRRVAFDEYNGLAFRVEIIEP